MNWLTTDLDVACSITVIKKINENVTLGYPKTYNILYAFMQYDVISVIEWQKMEYTQQLNRINAFKNYVNNIEFININETQINNVFRLAIGTPGELVGWLLSQGVWNDSEVWNDKAKWPLI